MKAQALGFICGMSRKTNLKDFTPFKDIQGKQAIQKKTYLTFHAASDRHLFNETIYYTE